MKRSLQILSFLALGSTLQAATHAVLSGQALQPKIDAAAPGDIIAIFGGTYPGDVVINKAVRLVEVDGQDVTITGNVTWSNVTNAPPFEGFTVGSAGKGITINNTTGLTIKQVNAQTGFGIKINGPSKVSIRDSVIKSIEQDGGELAVSDTEFPDYTGTFIATINSQKTVAFRINSKVIMTWGSKKSWVGYSIVRRFTFNGSNSDILVIGSSFTGPYLSSGDVPYPLDRPSNHIEIQGHYNSFQLYNSAFGGGWSRLNANGDQAWGGGATRCVAVFGSENRNVICNNSFLMSYSGLQGGHGVWPDASWDGGCGVLVTSPNSFIANNIIVGSNTAISAPFGATATNNLSHGAISGHDRGGVVPNNWINGDPLLLGSWSSAWRENPPLQAVLQVSSPCTNAGVNSPVFNDLDGTRNDIGPRGGCLYDPDAWTTNKPVVISFDLAPQQLLKGVDTQVTISNGQAVAQP